MRVFSREKIITQLEKEGLRFSSFEIIHEGNYATDDSDWNYKDLSHIPHVHQGVVDAIPAMIGQDFMATINMQNAFGLRIPLSVFNYQPESDSQVYYTTSMFYVLIIQTSHEKISINRTRVVTVYSVGYPPLMAWTFPIIRWSLKRNFKKLMATDIPMRERRGQLREWGYAFRKLGIRYGFEETTDTSRNNVDVSGAVRRDGETITILIMEALPSDGEYLIGRADHHGLRIVRQGDEIRVFPRMCLHEGARLDEQQCDGHGKIRCPWHGRPIAPLGRFRLNKSETQTAVSESHEIELNKNVLHIRLS